MCDPVTATLVSGAVSLAGGAIAGQQQAAAEQDLMDKQNAANAQWVAYQNQIRKNQVNAEEQQRTVADTARQQTLSQMSPENQEAMQTAESQRLNNLYTGPQVQSPTNATPANTLLSGESSGNKTFMNSLTQQVNQATTQARGRIANLATANSFGGSFGGLGTTDPILFQQGGNQINLANAVRNSNLKAYGVEQQVQPLQYTMGPNFNTMGTIGKSLASIGGSLFGQGLKGSGASLGSIASGVFGGGGGGGGGGGAMSTDEIFNNLPNNTFDNAWA